MPSASSSRRDPYVVYFELAEGLPSQAWISVAHNPLDDRVRHSSVDLTTPPSQSIASDELLPPLGSATSTASDELH